MTIEFNCPRCDKVLRTTDDKAGRQAKCPGCGELITIPEWSGEHQDSSFVSEGIDQELPPVPSPLSDRSREMKSCPMCGVETRGDAIRCRSCGEVFKSESRLIQGRPSGFREMRPFPPGEVISEAWRIFTEKMGILIGSLMTMVFLVLVVLSAVSIPAALGEFLYENGNEFGAIVVWGISIPLYFAALYFCVYIQTGYMILQLKAAREEPIRLDDLFSGGPYVGRMILNSILFGGLILLGSVAFVIPAFLLAVMFWPYGHLLVDKNCPGIECLTRSKALTDGNWGSLFIVMIVCGASMFAGYLVCFVGLIIAVPFVNLVLAVAYDRMACQTPLNSTNLK